MARLPRGPRARDIEGAYPTIVGAIVLAVLFLIWREGMKRAGKEHLVPPQATGGL